MKVPEWVDLVKNGKHKELAPYDDDWYYTRAGLFKLNVYIEYNLINLFLVGQHVRKKSSIHSSVVYREGK